VHRDLRLFACYARAFRSAGENDLTPGEISSAGIQGVTIGSTGLGRLDEGVNGMETSEIADRVMYGRSSLLGAIAWMFGLSFILTILLGWIPVVGPFLGPTLGGYVGGRRAGTAGRALLAALIPALLLSVMILGIGALAATFSHLPIVGAVGTVIAGAIGVILFVHNLLLFLAALIGGIVRQSQAR